MKLIVTAAMFSSFFLAGCDQSVKDMAGDADVNARLALIRIAELEKRVQHLEKSQKVARQIAEPISPTIKKIEAARFMLVGPRTLAGTGTEFPSLERCENARASIIEQAAERAERARTRGIITLGEPQVSCMPL